MAKSPEDQVIFLITPRNPKSILEGGRSIINSLTPIYYNSKSDGVHRRRGVANNNSVGRSAGNGNVSSHPTLAESS